MKATAPFAEYPNCLQTTWASYESNESSQTITVPHWLFKQSSTLPSYTFDPLTKCVDPLTRRMLPLLHTTNGYLITKLALNDLPNGVGVGLTVNMLLVESVDETLLGKHPIWAMSGQQSLSW